MRVLALVIALLVLPMAAQAQDSGSSAAESVPTPNVEAPVDFYRVGSIAVGAVGGVIVANAVTGGLITPLMTVGMAGGGMNAGMVTAAVTQTAVAIAGAVGGGYLGNWYYETTLKY